MTYLLPLHYAIIKLFDDEKEHDAREVVSLLSLEYGKCKLLNCNDVEETLLTAKENQILTEARCEFDKKKEIRVFYRITSFGKEMIRKYLN